MTVKYIIDNKLNPITGWPRDIIQDTDNNNDNNE